MFGRTQLIAALAAASSAAAQLSLPSSAFGLTFSATCQASILSVVTSGSFAQCFPLVPDLIPAITGNTSLIPALDTFMSSICYSSPCTNDTLMNATQTILSGCASDLAGEGLSNSTVTMAFASYPLVREILCLKTSTPYTNASYGGILGQPPIPITNATFNSTGGYFCVTSLLTQLSAYFGTSLTLPYIEGLATGTNTTALGLAESISSTILCNDCIFAALDLIEEVYPVVGTVPLSTIFGLLNMTAPVNTTVNGLFNGTCSYIPLAVTTNGTIPHNTTVSILNSTFPYNVTTASMKRRGTLFSRLWRL